MGFNEINYRRLYNSIYYKELTFQEFALKKAVSGGKNSLSTTKRSLIWAIMTKLAKNTRIVGQNDPIQQY